MSELYLLQLKLLIPSQFWGLEVLNGLTLNFQRVSFLLIQAGTGRRGSVFQGPGHFVWCSLLCCADHLGLFLCYSFQKIDTYGGTARAGALGGSQGFSTDLV